MNRFISRNRAHDATVRKQKFLIDFDIEMNVAVSNLCPVTRFLNEGFRSFACPSR
jgi:hypothetical protein